jgi:hypothetical protein
VVGLIIAIVQLFKTKKAINAAKDAAIQTQQLAECHYE